MNIYKTQNKILFMKIHSLKIKALLINFLIKLNKLIVSIKKQNYLIKVQNKLNLNNKIFQIKMI